MSFETGRTTGLVASIIAVVLPVIALVGFGALLFALISSLTSTIAGNASLVNPFAFSIGLIALAAVVVILAIIGFVLFVVSMYNLSHYYNEPNIFKNVLYAILLVVIQIVVVVVLFITFFTIASTSIGPATTNPSSVSLFPIVSLVAVVAVSIILGIISALFIMRAFNKLAEKSGVDSFKTAGLLYFIGVILSIVFVGGLIQWIGWIFAAMGFYRLKPSVTPPVSYPQMPLTVKRCPHCGAENSPEAAYCKACGRPI